MTRTAQGHALALPYMGRFGALAPDSILLGMSTVFPPSSSSVNTATYSDVLVASGGAPFQIIGDKLDPNSNLTISLGGTFQISSATLVTLGVRVDDGINPAADYDVCAWTAVGTTGGQYRPFHAYRVIPGIAAATLTITMRMKVVVVNTATFGTNSSGFLRALETLP